MRKSKPTLYVDTNIPSVLYYRGSNIATIHQQMVTREWWAPDRYWFRIHASVLTEGELRQGVFPGQEQAIRLVRRLRYLPFTADVRECAGVFLEERLIPAERPGDAMQLAFATVHGMDYLLTWNYAHLANVDTQRRLKAISRRQGWRMPLLVSPETIPLGTLGQVIRRKQDETED